MTNSALVVIDIQNDITKNYKEIIGNINQMIDWARKNDVHILYIRHENLSSGTRTFKPNSHGSQLVPDLLIASKNIFTKYKANALTSDAFSAFISEHQLTDFYVTGADATVCVKSTCYNLRKKNYTVNVLTDCITSYNKKKMDEMFQYYASKNWHLITSKSLLV